MAKVTEAHVEARRQQILEASCKRFSQQGFHRTTVRDICRQAGLSSGAVYGYFKSKDEILEALAELGRQNTRALLEAARSDESPPRALTHLLETVVSCFDSDQSQEGIRLDVRLWGEALDTSRIRELFLEALPNTCAPVVELVREGQERGEISTQLEPDSVARVCVALWLGLQVQKALDPDAELAGCAKVISALFGGTFTTERNDG